jgi:hypothetical protein
MKEKKHIDRLFQESFKDFEVTPNDKVWQNIDAKLNDNKKKRRVIPIWWRYAGVAAILLILFSLGNIYFNSENVASPNQISDTNSDANIIIKDDSKLPEITPVTDSDAVKSAISSNDKDNFNEPVPNQNAITKTLNSDKPITNKRDSVNKSLSVDKNNRPHTYQENKIADVKEIQSNPEILNKEIASSFNQNDSTLIAKDFEKKNVLKNDNSEDTQTLIEDVIADTQKDPEQKNLNKWIVTTNAAPVYFNSLGKGSSLGSEFSENSKSGDITMSYGISASYAINKKIRVRSGINKVNLGYNTNNVLIFETIGLNINASTNKNINPNNMSQSVSIISGKVLSDLNNRNLIQSSNTTINQSLGYIEVPLEIEYAIIDKKFRFNVIGGFSSLFLSNNSLFYNSNGERMRIGEATNLNKMSYSANFGLGFNYNLSKSFDFNLEPVFKYQINAFNSNTGNFNPYFIGIYTGIGFKF